MARERLWILLFMARMQLVIEFLTGKDKDQGLGGLGRGGFGPKALPVSRWGRLVRDNSRCRANSLIPCSLYSGLVSEARNATRSSISPSVRASGWMSWSR